jgi:hypothetical protein
MSTFVGKVASYNGGTLKVTELFSKAILMSMFTLGDCMDVWSLLYTCQQQLWLNIFNEWVSTYFCIYSVYSMSDLLLLPVY